MMIRRRVLVAFSLPLLVLGCGRNDKTAPPASTGSGASLTPGANGASSAGSSASGSAGANVIGSAGSAGAASSEVAVEPDDPRSAYDCEPDDQNVPEGLHDRVPFLDEKTERSGYKTRAGKIVLAVRYKDALPFGPGGVAAVRLDDKGSPNPWRFIDPAGKVLATPHLFDNGPDYWQEGLARIVDARGKFGFISDKGEIVVPPTYDFAYPFCHGIAKTALGGKAGYIDTAGKPAPAPPADDRPLIPERHID